MCALLSCDRHSRTQSPQRFISDRALTRRYSIGPLTRPVNAVTRKAYRGVNAHAFWASAEA